MAHSVCPWWLGYFLLNPWRRRSQNPASILGSYIRPGMTVLEPGPGMGFFTLELARMVGSSGRVIAVDIQRKMLDKLKHRALKAGLAGNLEARTATPASMGISDMAGKVDFTLAFSLWFTSFPTPGTFFRKSQLPRNLALHFYWPSQPDTSRQRCLPELEAAAQAGFHIVEHPAIRKSQAVLLRKAA